MTIASSDMHPTNWKTTGTLHTLLWLHCRLVLVIDEKLCICNCQLLWLERNVTHSILFSHRFSKVLGTRYFIVYFQAFYFIGSSRTWSGYEMISDVSSDRYKTSTGIYRNPDRPSLCIYWIGQHILNLVFLIGKRTNAVPNPRKVHQTLTKWKSLKLCPIKNITFPCRYWAILYPLRDQYCQKRVVRSLGGFSASLKHEPSEVLVCKGLPRLFRRWHIGQAVKVFFKRH